MEFLSTFTHNFRIKGKYYFKINFQFFGTTDEQIMIIMSLGIYNRLTLQKSFYFPMILCTATNINFHINDYLQYGNGEFLSMNYLSQKLGVPMCDKMLNDIRNEICVFVNHSIYFYLRDGLRRDMIRRSGI
jgi:hypothetical protein